IYHIAAQYIMSFMPGTNYSLRLDFNRGGHHHNCKETRFEHKPILHCIVDVIYWNILIFAIQVPQSKGAKWAYS
ncbi:MAG: hypothetical protein AAB676_13555, partial [Verrucomicrobiota bacterium]